MSNIEITNIQINSAAIKGKIEALLDEETMREIQQVFAEIIDPWTPYLTGALSSNEHIFVSAEGVTYLVPYSAEKYYGEVYTKDVHPLATSHWDKVAMETQMPVLKQKVLEILQARAKELYG